MTEAQARAAGLTEEQIAELKLNSGGHKTPDEGHCLLEVVSMMAGEPFSDSPACVDPVLAAFGRSWNDSMRNDEEREQLKKYIPLLLNTNKGPALSVARSFMALDWLWREHAALAMEQVPELAEHAATLRALAPITAELGEAERSAAVEKVGAAARAARAAWGARDAWAAWDAAAAAFQTAAYEAAKGSATYEEARAKADAVFDRHRDAVRAQLHSLFQKMIEAA